MPPFPFFISFSVSDVDDRVWMELREEFITSNICTNLAAKEIMKKFVIQKRVQEIESRTDIDDHNVYCQGSVREMLASSEGGMRTQDFFFAKKGKRKFSVKDLCSSLHEFITPVNARQHHQLVLISISSMT